MTLHRIVILGQKPDGTPQTDERRRFGLYAENTSAGFAVDAAGHWASEHGIQIESIEVQEEEDPFLPGPE